MLSSARLRVTNNAKDPVLFPFEPHTSFCSGIANDNSKEGVKSLRDKRGLCLCDQGEAAGTRGPTAQLLHEGTEHPIWFISHLLRDDKISLLERTPRTDKTR